MISPLLRLTFKETSLAKSPPGTAPSSSRSVDLAEFGAFIPVRRWRDGLVAHTLMARRPRVDTPTKQHTGRAGSNVSSVMSGPLPSARAQ